MSDGKSEIEYNSKVRNHINTTNFNPEKFSDLRYTAGSNTSAYDNFNQANDYMNAPSHNQSYYQQIKKSKLNYDYSTLEKEMSVKHERQTNEGFSTIDLKQGQTSLRKAKSPSKIDNNKTNDSYGPEFKKFDTCQQKNIEPINYSAQILGCEDSKGQTSDSIYHNDYSTMMSRINALEQKNLELHKILKNYDNQQVINQASSKHGKMGSNNKNHLNLDEPLTSNNHAITTSYLRENSANRGLTINNNLGATPNDKNNIEEITVNTLISDESVKIVYELQRMLVSTHI